MTTAEVSAAVLAGGTSSRMGVDKALLEVDGVPMAQRVAEVLSAATQSSVLLVGGPASTADLLGLAYVPDAIVGEGPLVGVWTAMSATVGDVIISACDLPFLDTATVSRFLEAQCASGDVAVAVVDGMPQQSLARWNRSVFTRVAEAVVSGQRSLRDVLATVDVVEVPCERSPLLNANRPSDLASNRNDVDGASVNVRTIG
jgi:molybdopterin-guanine dinucleotide biosynthesis protein A